MLLLQLLQGPIQFSQVMFFFLRCLSRAQLRVPNEDKSYGSYHRYTRTVGMIS